MTLRVVPQSCFENRLKPLRDVPRMAMSRAGNSSHLRNFSASHVVLTRSISIEN
jgi:hypothetical protein